jgi:phospholipase C
MQFAMHAAPRDHRPGDRWRETMKNLDKIDHIVVLMLENRSLDNLFGYLYEGDDQPTRFIGEFGDTPAFDGVAGKALSNPAPDGHEVPVQRAPYATLEDMCHPCPDPGEHFFPHVNRQLYGTESPDDASPPTMRGFVLDYVEAIREQTIGKEITEDAYRVIMNCFTPEAIPVLSGLARAFAVSDRWFCSVPSQTFCNRSFFHSGQSHGFVTNPDYVKWAQNTAPTIFERLADAGRRWRVYFDAEDLLSMTRSIHRPLYDPKHDESFRFFTRFAADCQDRDLPDYTFIEPRLVVDHNDMHPPLVFNPLVMSSVLAGEQLVADVYDAVRTSPLWPRTLLVIVFDEHGGCYDHVPPPTGVAAPAPTAAPERGFRFDRLGVRVPAVFVSPFVEERTLVRSSGPIPFDHTTMIRTICEKWGLPALDARDEIAPSLEPLLTRDTPRLDPPAFLPRPYHRTPLDIARNLPLSPHQESVIRAFSTALEVPLAEAAGTVGRALDRLRAALKARGNRS